MIHGGRDPASVLNSFEETSAHVFASLCHLTAGDHRLAGHLAEMAALASPDDSAVATIRSTVFSRRAKLERSTMAKGVFAWAGQDVQP